MAIINVLTDNFDQEVLKSDLPVLVDFWAPWCGPCKMLGPILHAVDEEAAGKFKVCKINIDEDPKLAARFGVMSIPTMIVFEKGVEVNKMVGVRSKDELLSVMIK